VASLGNKGNEKNVNCWKPLKPNDLKRCESRNNNWDYSEVETELNIDNGQSAAKPERGGSETIIVPSF